MNGYMVSKFTLQEITSSEPRVIDVYDNWDDVMGPVFDATDRTQMIIYEKDLESGDTHSYHFNEDAIVSSIVHHCHESYTCPRNELMTSNRYRVLNDL